MAGLRTVHKLGPLLDLFTVERHTWGVSEVSAELGIPRSSAHASLSSLVDIGLLQTRGRGRYTIGWRVLELAEVLRSRTDLRSLAAPVLEDLVRDHGETTHLAVIDRMSVLYIDKVMGTHNIVVQGARVGSRLEMHCTAVGKLLLAFEDRSKVTDFFQHRELPPHTSTTITDVSVLLAELDEIGRRGIAYDRGEQVFDIRCVAMPVRDDMGEVVAALSMSAPANRFEKNQNTLINGVRDAVAHIQRRLTDYVDSTSAGIGAPGVPAHRNWQPSRRT